MDVADQAVSKIDHWPYSFDMKPNEFDQNDIVRRLAGIDNILHDSQLIIIETTFTFKMKKM